MKTPRALLFERHRAVETKLDAVRESAVASIRDGQAVEKTSTRSNKRPALRDLLRSLRWHFAGLSAAWLVALLLNLESSSAPAANLAREDRMTPQQLLASLGAYRQQLWQFLEPIPDEPPIAPPRPRSEIRNFREIV